MSEPIIRVHNLAKRYTLGAIGGNTLRDQVLRSWAKIRGRDPQEILGNVGQNAAAPSVSEFWALQDVSFDVRPGEVLGIIGRNGSGKSTLLKLLSRITLPTRGEIQLRGKVGSLLEVGTGFHPELTGRENVYMNGTILGMKRREITAKFDEIIAFSGIERFIDTPVKRYSSGMSVRLAFAVAAHLEPDILIIDEVLAVGDSAFQEKCLGKMDDVARQGRTILFVSHQMGSVSRLCTRGIYLSAGRVKVNGTVEEVVETYIRENSSGHAGSYTVSDTGHPPGGARILSATLKDSEDRDSGEVDYHRAHSISVRLETSGVKDLTLTLAVVDSFDRRLFATKIPCPDGPGPITLSLRFPPATILPGGYHLQLALLDHQHHPHDLVPLAFRYTLSDPGGHLELPPHGGYGLVALPVTYSHS